MLLRKKWRAVGAVTNAWTMRPGPWSRSLEERHINQHENADNNEDTGNDQLHKFRGRDSLDERTELSADNQREHEPELECHEQSPIA